MALKKPGQPEKPKNLPEGLMLNTLTFEDLSKITFAEAKALIQANYDAEVMGSDLFDADADLDDYLDAQRDNRCVLEDLIAASELLNLVSIENLSLRDCLQIVTAVFRGGGFESSLDENLVAKQAEASQRQLGRLFAGAKVVTLPTRLTEEQEEADSLHAGMNLTDPDGIAAENAITHLVEGFEVGLFSVTPAFRAEYERREAEAHQNGQE